ncbi:MAG: hypothetical protein IJ574_04075 [Bacilli bacterium]|nr:hypothetical protein [Bacilli bacterium]
MRDYNKKNDIIKKENLSKKYNQEIKANETDLQEQYEMLNKSESLENNKRTYYAIITCTILVLLIILFAICSYNKVYKEQNNNKSNNQEELNNINSYILNYDTNGNKFVINNITPGMVGENVQTFSIQNKGSYTISYDIVWTNVINELENTNHLVYTITRNGTVVKSNVSLPTKEDYMLQKETVSANEKNTYVLSYQYVDSNEEQNNDQGKTFNADFIIKNVVLK